MGWLLVETNGFFFHLLDVSILNVETYFKMPLLVCYCCRRFLDWEYSEAEEIHLNTLSLCFFPPVSCVAGENKMLIYYDRIVSEQIVLHIPQIFKQMLLLMIQYCGKVRLASGDILFR